MQWQGLVWYEGEDEACKGVCRYLFVCLGWDTLRRLGGKVVKRFEET